MMTVTWDDIGRSPLPASYHVGDTNGVIREAGIAVRRDHPSTASTTTWCKRGRTIGSKALAGWSEPKDVSAPIAVEETPA